MKINKFDKKKIPENKRPQNLLRSILRRYVATYGGAKHRQARAGDHSSTTYLRASGSCRSGNSHPINLLVYIIQMLLTRNNWRESLVHNNTKDQAVIASRKKIVRETQQRQSNCNIIKIYYCILISISYLLTYF
uniref:Uncharacterized protein n=1 Tax=Glossina palpalis gambiensis TaxID=67801 RepID=A0A1B0AUZ8_9MUSC